LIKFYESPNNQFETAALVSRFKVSSR